MPSAGVRSVGVVRNRSRIRRRPPGVDKRRVACGGREPVAGWASEPARSADSLGLALGSSMFFGAYRVGGSGWPSHDAPVIRGRVNSAEAVTASEPGTR